MPSISNLESLVLLYMQNNSLSGEIPLTIYTLKNLKFLNLTNNNLRGTIPNNIGNLSNLVTLLLGNNLITGPLPTALSNLTALKDYFIFSPYPSQMTYEPRAFSQLKFKCDFSVLPPKGVDSVCWDPETVFGPVSLIRK